MHFNGCSNPQTGSFLRAILRFDFRYLVMMTILLPPLPRKRSLPITLPKSGSFLGVGLGYRRMTYVNRIIPVGNRNRPNGHGPRQYPDDYHAFGPGEKFKYSLRIQRSLALSCRMRYANNNNNYITTFVIVIRPYTVVYIVEPFCFYPWWYRAITIIVRLRTSVALATTYYYV